MKNLTKDRSTSTENLFPINTHSAASLDLNYQSDKVFEEMLEAISEFSSYEDDWDGQGAIAPTRYTIARAKEHLRSLDSESRLLPFDVSIGPDGSVIIEWDCQRFIQIVEIDDADRRFTVIDRLNKTSHTSSF